jgi:hypothetical protein
MKTYILKSTPAPATVAPAPAPDKPAIARIVPPRQPLPTAVIDSAKAKGREMASRPSTGGFNTGLE